VLVGVLERNTLQPYTCQIAMISALFYSPASRKIGGGARLGYSHVEACQLEFTPVMNLQTLSYCYRLSSELV